MPQEHESVRSVGPANWPQDRDHRIAVARAVTLAARRPYVEAEKRREEAEAAAEAAILAKVMQSPKQKTPKGVEGAQTK